MEPSETGSVTGPSAKGPEAQAEPAGRAGRFSPAAWVLLTLAAGIAGGLLMSALSPAPLLEPRPPREFFRLASHSDVDMLLSSVGIALLAALLIVYVRTYRQTGANFVMGLVFVLLALLVQSAVSSPMLIGVFGHPLGPLASFFLVADVFKSAAFALFLYLSLQ
jgi:hypothetical protein